MGKKVNYDNTNNNKNLKIFSFSLYILNALIANYFPLYFDSLGYSKLQIGSINSIGLLISIVSNLFWGWISDSYQMIKKLMLIILGTQMLISALLFQLETYHWVLLVMLFFFFFHNPLSSLNDSQILLAIRHQNKSYASYRLWGSLGFAFASVVFGFVFQIYSMHSMWFIYYLVIIITILMLLTLQDRSGIKLKNQLSGISKIIKNKKLLWYLFLIFSIGCAIRINDHFLGLYMQDLGASKTLIGWSWLVSATSEIPVFLFMSKYGHRYRASIMLSIASFFFTVRFYLMTIVENPVEIIFIQTMHSITFGIFLFSSIRFIQSMIPDAFRATGQAIFTVTWVSLAGLVSGTIGGYVYDRWGATTIYAGASCIAFLSCLCFMVTSISEKPRKNPI